MAILKTMGQSGGGLRSVYLVLYGGTVLLGLLLGLIFSWSVAGLLTKAMVPSTGMLIERIFPTGLITAIFLGILLLFAMFLLARTGKILRITPIQTIQENFQISI